MDKLRTPFRNPHSVPGLKSAGGCYDKAPYEGVDQPGTNFLPQKTIEDLGPRAAPGKKQDFRLDKVRTTMRSNIAKG